MKKWRVFFWLNDKLIRQIDVKANKIHEAVIYASYKYASESLTHCDRVTGEEIKDYGREIDPTIPANVARIEQPHCISDHERKQQMSYMSYMSYVTE